jgi:anti-sigma factor RsiW
MSTGPGHPSDEIQDLLDGRLDASARERVERHLEACAECRREWQAMLKAKTAAARVLPVKDVPAEVNAEIRALFDREDSSGTSPRGQRMRRWLPVAAVAASLLIALAILLPGRRNPPSRVAQDYQNHKAGALPLAVRTQDPQELERYFMSRGVSFPARVLDLRMMGYRLVGGRVLNPDGRKRAFFVYRGPNDEILACQMYEGDVRRLPKADAVRRNGSFTFFVFRRGGSTQVFWQEGDVTCALVSDLPEEELVQLAFAKAMQPRAPE